MTCVRQGWSHRVLRIIYERLSDHMQLDDHRKSQVHVVSLAGKKVHQNHFELELVADRDKDQSVRRIPRPQTQWTQ